MCLDWVSYYVWIKVVFWSLLVLVQFLASTNPIWSRFCSFYKRQIYLNITICLCIRSFNLEITSGFFEKVILRWRRVKITSRLSTHIHYNLEPWLKILLESHWKKIKLSKFLFYFRFILFYKFFSNSEAQELEELESIKWYDVVLTEKVKNVHLIFFPVRFCWKIIRSFPIS